MFTINKVNVIGGEVHPWTAVCEKSANGHYLQISGEYIQIIAVGCYEGPEIYEKTFPCYAIALIAEMETATPANEGRFVSIIMRPKIEALEAVGGSNIHAETRFKFERIVAEGYGVQL